MARSSLSKKDDYTAHWEATIMGLDFWREQDRKNNSFQKDPSSSGNHYPRTLLTYQHLLIILSFCTDKQTDSTRPQSPRNAPQPSEATTIENRRSRRFSIVDGWGKDALSVSKTDLASIPQSSSRLFDFAKRQTSRQMNSSPSKRSTGGFFLRTPFSISSGRSKRRESIDSVLSLPSPQGLGTPDKPFLYFRGGVSWRYLNTNTQNLGLDLFWPIMEDEEYENDRGSEMLNIEELRPLCAFRNLRVLKVTGMMQSYQKYIWQTAWLNQDLEELELEMALEPCVRKNIVAGWPLIRGGWKLQETQYGDPVY